MVASRFEAAGKPVIKAAEKDDQVSAGLATSHMNVRAQNAWMLRSHLE